MPSASRGPGRRRASPGSARAGFSLIELVVYSALLLFLLGGVYLMVAGGVRYLQLGSAFEAAQQQALIGMRRMEAEVANASRSALQFGVNPSPHLLLLSPDRLLPSREHWTYDGTTLVYRKWICYYLDSNSLALMRTEIGLGAPATIPPLPPVPDFAADILPIGPPRTQVVARNINNLVVGYGATNQFVRLELEALEETGSDKATAVTLSTEVKLVNE